MRSKQGFTLAEIIIVVAIMSIIAGIVLFNVSTASKKSRDGDRQADLRTLQSAVELYKQKYGRYPDGCNGPNVWSGQLGSSYACSRNNGIYTLYVGTGQYIIGHAVGLKFAPEFIRALPTDKKLLDANSGYVYTTNAEGTVYKIMARRTVESEVVDNSHPFKSCDVTDSSAGVCDNTSGVNGWSGNAPNECQPSHPNLQFKTSYAVWGGFPLEPNKNPPGNSREQEMQEKIVCLP